MVLKSYIAESSPERIVRIVEEDGKEVARYVATRNEIVIESPYLKSGKIVVNTKEVLKYPLSFARVLEEQGMPHDLAQSIRRTLVDDIRALLVKSMELGARTAETKTVYPTVPRTTHGENVSAPIIERIAEELRKISPRLEEVFRSALKKSPRELTDAEKKVLILARIIENTLSAGIDTARKSGHVPRSTESWLLNPSRRDIPGVDTPDAWETYQYIKKLWKKKRFDELVRFILGETVVA